MRPVVAISIMVSAACAGAQTKPRQPPETFDEIARKADAARDRDRLEEAARLYQRALRIKPAWADGWWSLGTIFYDSDRHAECVTAFTRFVALKPDVGPARALLGLCEFGRANYDAALHHLFRAQEIGFAGDSRIRDVSLYHTVLGLIVKQNFEKAIEQLAMLVAASSPGAAVRTAAGLAALRKPLLPDQVPEADRSLVTKVGDAVIAQLERRPEDAARGFDAILAAYPRTPEVRYAYGALLLSSDPPKGLAMLKLELELSPDHVPALASIALEYLKENDAAAARPYAEKAARLAPDDFVARTAYGRVLLEVDQIPDAIQQLEAAVKLAPDSPHARFALANAYARAGRNEDAVRERKEFARLQKLVDSGRK
jgi:tetratricopeptide (TPR) repeat protein